MHFKHELLFTCLKEIGRYHKRVVLQVIGHGLLLGLVAKRTVRVNEKQANQEARHLGEDMMVSVRKHK